MMMMITVAVALPVTVSRRRFFIGSVQAQNWIAFDSVFPRTKQEEVVMVPLQLWGSFEWK